jgi:5-methylcytosine-specific restriction endonuclease McrA
MATADVLEKLLVSHNRTKTVWDMEDDEVNDSLKWLLRRGTISGHFDSRELLLLLVQRFDFALLDLSLANQYRLAPGVVDPTLESKMTKRAQKILNKKPGASLVRALVRRTKIAADRLSKVGMPRDDSLVVEAAISETGELRCAYCGYHFLETDIRESLRESAGLDSSNLADAILPGRISDVWKPVQTQTKKGGVQLWTALEIEHRVPKAALGEDTIANLTVACRWCNWGKRAYQSFAEALPSLLAISLVELQGGWATGHIARAFYVAVNRNRACRTCGSTASNTELTVIATDPFAGLRRPFEAHSICYPCKSIE